MRRVMIHSVAAMLVLGIAPTVEAPIFFHFMQIERVIGGVGGDATAQAIQLRMRSTGQNLVAGSRIRVWDATGTNPVVVADPTTDVLNGGLGDRVLIASANFALTTNPPTVPDFVMTNLIPASYLAAGSMTFESDIGTQFYFRLSWGGAAYTGSTTGLFANDADGEFGPPYPDPLPSDFQALVFQGSTSALHTSNAADFALSPGVGVFTNNAGATFEIINPLSAAGSVPAGTRLHQNYPNPFNPSTRIAFSMETSDQVTLQIFDTAGRFVATLWDGVAPAGLNMREWSGRDAAGRPLATGIYYYRLTTPRTTEVRKMLLLK